MSTTTDPQPSNPRWRRISDRTETAMLTRFVQIMQAMDRNYQGLRWQQLACWLFKDPADCQCDIGDHHFQFDFCAVEQMEAFLWFKTDGSTDPDDAEIALLVSRRKKKIELLMIGWTPSELSGTAPSPVELDGVIAQLYSVLTWWIGFYRLQAAPIYAIRPKVMGNANVSALHRWVLQRGTTLPDPNYRFRVTTRNLGDSECWQLLRV